MTAYLLTSATSGQDIGVYSGETEEHAIAAMLRDGGYTADVVDGEVVTSCEGFDRDDLDVREAVGSVAIEAAESGAAYGWQLCSHADPTASAQLGLSVEDAREIAAEDPSLIYLLPEAGAEEAASRGAVA